MTEPQTTFQRLLSPISSETFLRDYLGSKALHIPGKRSRARSVCTWQQFDELVNMNGLWTGETFKLVLDGQSIPQDRYCIQRQGRDNHPVPELHMEEVQNYLNEGATLIAELAEGLSPGIRAAAQALEMGLGATVSCNVYMSQKARKAFPSHFDTMDVVVLQAEGTKLWRVYRGRFEHPLERPGLSYPYFDQEHHEQAKGEIDFEVELRPGDILYIPAGVYHDALATSGSCLHLSFGITRLTALDYYRWLLNSLEDLPAFRAPIPDYAQGEAARSHLAEVDEQLCKLLKGGKAAEQYPTEQHRIAHQRLRSLRLPADDTATDTCFRVVPSMLTPNGQAGGLCAPGGHLDLTDDGLRIARWLSERDHCLRSEIEQRFHKVATEDICNWIGRFESVGWLIRI